MSDFSSIGIYGFITGNLGIANAWEYSVEMGGGVHPSEGMDMFTASVFFSLPSISLY